MDMQLETPFAYTEQRRRAEPVRISLCLWRIWRLWRWLWCWGWQNSIRRR